MHIPRTISCACTLFLTRGGAIQAIQCIAIATGPRKYSYDLLQGLRAWELPYMYQFMILLTLLTESMVDRDMLLGKELGPLNIYFVYIF